MREGARYVLWEYVRFALYCALSIVSSQSKNFQFLSEQPLGIETKVGRLHTAYQSWGLLLVLGTALSVVRTKSICEIKSSKTQIFFIRLEPPISVTIIPHFMENERNLIRVLHGV